MAPNFQKPFLVSTDAFKDALYAVLEQQIKNQVHPIAYLSQAT